VKNGRGKKVLPSMNIKTRSKGGNTNRKEGKEGNKSRNGGEQNAIRILPNSSGGTRKVLVGGGAVWKKTLNERAIRTQHDIEEAKFDRLKVSGETGGRLIFGEDTR